MGFPSLTLMPIVAKSSDVAGLLIFAAIVVGLTALASWLIGRRLAARNRAVAFIVCGAIVPAAIFTVAEVLLATPP